MHLTAMLVAVVENSAIARADALSEGGLSLFPESARSLPCPLLQNLKFFFSMMIDKGAQTAAFHYFGYLRWTRALFLQPSLRLRL